MTQFFFSRRALIGGGAAAGFFAAGGIKMSFAATPNDARLVVILLRGAMDGLNVIVPYADPGYAAARNQIALSPGNGATKLDGFFAVNDALPFFAESYRDKTALAFHAVATPYRDRSHFDAQNIMETGGTRPYEVQSGWLNRAVGAIPGFQPSSAVAVAQSMPTVLIGAAKTGSYSPARMPEVPADTTSRIMRLYAGDAQLSSAFSEAQILAALAEDATEDTPAMGGARKNQGNLASMAATAAQLMRAADGPRITVLERGGWDTHANQPGLLRAGLADLNAALVTLKSGLGPLWGKTAVLCITEFGRTVHVNGTNGTDHGTGSAALLFGGAVKGGKVVADWPGLAAANLQDGRDLKPTTDMRSIIGGLLMTQLGLSEKAMASVFPDSQSVRWKTDIVTL
jgi:uncharacterized protein (DUF1501 family)